ncbi:MAG TPA: hypothetical protein VH325_13320 [Bryobacteraceae bacterium]|nr:hypothetical protein [Bryobacteraceae bacterium]
MPDITDGVGDGGTNKVHDVAIVQAMLTVVKNAKGNPYLTDYDGKSGPSTIHAITAFQTDQGLIPKPPPPAPHHGAHHAGHPAAPPPPPPAAPAAAGEKPGLVAKGSTTLAKMVGALPADFAPMRIIENTRTVYFPGTDADENASSNAINTTGDLEPAFRSKVVQLVDLMFSTHKIVLSVTATGGHRTFQQQSDTIKKGTSTKAGPGESNHNFGRAVDIGFNGFQWLKGDGAKATDDWWLNKLTKDGKDKVGIARAAELWKARDVIAVNGTPGLFNSILSGDDIHLQSFDDNLPNDRALVDLLNRVGSLKWEAEHKKPRRYNCDLGFGGKMFNVGTSVEIWDLKPTVTKKMIAEAKTDVLIRAAADKGAAAVKAVVHVKESTITDAEVVALRKALKDDFIAAETNWLNWRSVP